MAEKRQNRLNEPQARSEGWHRCIVSYHTPPAGTLDEFIPRRSNGHQSQFVEIFFFFFFGDPARHFYFFRSPLFRSHTPLLAMDDDGGPSESFAHERHTTWQFGKGFGFSQTRQTRCAAALNRLMFSPCYMVFYALVSAACIAMFIWTLATRLDGNHCSTCLASGCAMWSTNGHTRVWIIERRTSAVPRKSSTDTCNSAA